jgi:hypothetical protein
MKRDVTAAAATTTTTTTTTTTIIIIIIISWKTYEVLVSIIPAFLFKNGIRQPSFFNNFSNRTHDVFHA